MHTRSKAWQKTRHRRTPAHVGEFFNHLAASVVGGSTNGGVYDSSEPEFGDVSVPSLGVCIESKGSGGGGHHWRLHMSQRSIYTDARPLISYMYFLAGYQGRSWVRKDGKKPKGIRSRSYSALARAESKKEQFQILSERTEFAYLFDLEFIQAIERLGIGRTDENGFGGGRLVYELRRRELSVFQKPTERNMRLLGLNPEDWVFRKYDLSHRFSISSGGSWSEDDRAFRPIDYPISVNFRLYTALSLDLDEKLDPVIRNRNDAGLPF